VAKDPRPGTSAHPSDPTAWSPIGYGEFAGGIEHYEQLQDQVVAAARHLAVTHVLELGTGTGETSRRLLAAHSAAHLVAMDASPAMLEAARHALPPERVSFVTGDIRDRLPEGSFDLIVSVLTVHHLDGNEKQNLYAMIVDRLAPGGAFVLGDIVVAPQDSARAGHPMSVLRRGIQGLRETRWRPGDIAVLLRQWVRRLSQTATSRGSDPAEDVDKPERIEDQIADLAAAGLISRTVWQVDGCAVLVGTKPV